MTWSRHEVPGADEPMWLLQDSQEGVYAGFGIQNGRSSALAAAIQIETYTGNRAGSYDNTVII